MRRRARARPWPAASRRAQGRNPSGPGGGGGWFAGEDTLLGATPASGVWGCVRGACVCLRQEQTPEEGEGNAESIPPPPPSPATSTGGKGAGANGEPKRPSCWAKRARVKWQIRHNRASPEPRRAGRFPGGTQSSAAPLGARRAHAGQRTRGGLSPSEPCWDREAGGEDLEGACKSVLPLKHRQGGNGGCVCVCVSRRGAGPAVRFQPPQSGCP